MNEPHPHEKIPLQKGSYVPFQDAIHYTRPPGVQSNGHQRRNHKSQDMEIRHLSPEHHPPPVSPPLDPYPSGAEFYHHVHHHRRRRHHNSRNHDYDDDDDHLYRPLRPRSDSPRRTDRPQQTSATKRSKSTTASSRKHPNPQSDPDVPTPNRPPQSYTISKALKSACLGGGLEAIRARNEPGSWAGQKGQRVALAAAAGVVVGSLRNGKLQSSGKLPLAEALCTGFFAVEWWKKIGKDTSHVKKGEEEREVWRREREVWRREREVWRRERESKVMREGERGDDDGSEREEGDGKGRVRVESRFGRKGYGREGSRRRRRRRSH